MPALIASVVLWSAENGNISHNGAVLLLLRDPLWRNVATTRMLRRTCSALRSLKRIWRKRYATARRRGLMQVRGR